jgi:hypothetical protein
MRFATCLGSVCGLALATSISAQPPQPATPPPYPPALYQMTDVSKALNLTQDQITNLNKLTEQTQARYRDDYAKLANLKEADRFARMQELNRQYYADWSKGTRDIFNDTQRGRYQQLGYQYGGFNTLYDPDVQKRLNLTADQVRDLRAQWDWSDQQLRDINRIGATDAKKGTQMYSDYWKARQERFDKFLTAEQQKAWREMIGDPYTFQPTFTPPR